MTLYTYRDIKPSLGENVYIAPSADVIGKVTLENNVSIWHQCVLRGDVNTIVVGENSNVQDMSMLHVTSETKLVVGKNVSIGHSVTLHGCTIEDSCLIGMGAVILDGAVIGRNSVVAGGSVVPPGKVYPPNSMIMGNPAVVKRELKPEEILGYGNHYKSYLVYKDEFLNPQIVKEITC